MSTQSRMNSFGEHEPPLALDPRVVAACIAAAGAVAAITLFIRKRAVTRPAAVLSRCGKAITELERRGGCA